MGKVFFAVVAVLASLVLVESLTCNKCTFNIMGFCLDKTTENCTTNTSVCYTDSYTFTVFSKNLAFNSTGCRNDSMTCNNTISNSISAVANTVMLNYNVTTTCCTKDNCNALVLNAAPSARMSFSAAVGGALLASVLGSLL